MSLKQLSDLVYSIGETILLEIKDIKRVDYPHNTEFPDRFTVELRSGEKYELSISLKGEY